MLIRAKRFKAAQRSKWLAVLMDDFPLHASVWLDKSQVEVSRGSSVKGFNWRAGIQSSQGLWARLLLPTSRPKRRHLRDNVAITLW